MNIRNKGERMKYYKTVILRSTSINKVNIPAEVWKKLGWKLNDKLKLQYLFNGPGEDSKPVSLYITKED